MIDKPNIRHSPIAKAPTNPLLLAIL